MGIIRATALIDVGDLPDLGRHTGDLLVHDCRILMESLVADQPMQPQEAGYINIEGRGQRKMNREDDRLFLYIQKDAVTEALVRLEVATTLLWVRSG